VGHQLGRLGPAVMSADLLVGRTHLSGTTVSLVGGDPGVPMSHTFFFLLFLLYFLYYIYYIFIYPM
jgi:hypothetical protein